MFPGPRRWQGARSPSPFCQGHAKPWCYEILLERRGLQWNSFEECGIPHTSHPVTMAVNFTTSAGKTCPEGAQRPGGSIWKLLREPVFQRRDCQHVSLKKSSLSQTTRLQNPFPLNPLY